MGSGVAVSVFGFRGGSLLGSGEAVYWIPGGAGVSLLGSGEAVYWVLGRWSVYWVPERGVCAVNLLGSGGLPSVY